MMSSAYCKKDEDFMEDDILLTKTVNSEGPNIDLCGTPELAFHGD